MKGPGLAVRLHSGRPPFRCGWREWRLGRRPAPPPPAHPEHVAEPPGKGEGSSGEGWEAASFFLLCSLSQDGGLPLPFHDQP